MRSHLILCLCSLAAAAIIPTESIPSRRFLSTPAVCAQIDPLITGDVYLPFSLSLNYLQAKEHYMTSSTQTPLCVVEVASAQDISAVLKVIGQTKTPFAVKSGGHASNPGFSSTTGVMISLVRLKKVAVSADRTSVEIGTGNVRNTSEHCASERTCANLYEIALDRCIRRPRQHRTRRRRGSCHWSWCRRLHPRRRLLVAHKPVRLDGRHGHLFQRSPSQRHHHHRHRYQQPRPLLCAQGRPQPLRYRLLRHPKSLPTSPQGLGRPSNIHSAGDAQAHKSHRAIPTRKHRRQGASDPHDQRRPSSIRNPDHVLRRAHQTRRLPSL